MTRRLGLGAALAGLLIAALTAAGTPTASAAAPAADPMLGAPVVGQCFDMSRAELELASYPEAPVDCAATHTAQTIAVALMPADLTYDPTNRLLKFALETCYPAQQKVLGASLLGVRLTAYSVGYFAPTPEQQAAGARWLRCDLVLTHDDVLRPLPGRLKLGRYPYDKVVSRCLAGRDLHVAVCSETHTYRATAAIKIKLSTYPTERAWKRLGTDRCRHATFSRTYRFSWPSKVGWKVGDKTLLCYSKTRS